MKATGISIINLTKTDDRLDWTVQKWYVTDKDEKVIFSEADYHTNLHGEGLWCGDKQIVGTCDFHYSVKDPRRSFYRIFALDEKDKIDMYWDEQERINAPIWEAEE